MVINQSTQMLHPEVKPIINYRNIFSISQELAPHNQPFQRILQLAHRAGAKYCLQWHDPNNIEWEAELKLLYAYVHPPQPNYVIRLDFFSANPLSKNKGPNNYIGYVSLRPGTARTVVECMLKPRGCTKEHYLLSKSTWKTKYPISEEVCRGKCERGLPFYVARCGSWCLSLMLV